MTDPVRRLKRSRIALALGAVFGYPGPAALLFSDDAEPAEQPLDRQDGRGDTGGSG